MPGHNDVTFCFEWDLIWDSDEDWIGTNLAPKCDACLSVDTRVTMFLVQVIWQTNSAIVSLPSDLRKFLSKWKQFLQ